MQNRSFSYDKDLYRQSMSRKDKLSHHPYVPKPTSPYLFSDYSSESHVAYSNNTQVNSSEFDLPHYKGTRRRKGSERSFCCLVAALVFFILLSLVMTALFVWRLVCCQPKIVPKASQSEAVQPPVNRKCYLSQRAINMEPLPANIRDILEYQDAQIQKAVQQVKGRAALVTNIVYDDEIIWSRTYGALNATAAILQAPKTSTIFPIASVSKVLTALALFKVHSLGQLHSLNEEVVKLEPRFSIINPFNKHNITLRELGTQRSGLPREAPCYPPRNKTNLCPHDYMTMLKRISNLSLVREPGTEPQYSNFAYSLLGQVMAKMIGKMDYNAWMKQLILDPLEMKDTSFRLESRFKERIPVGYLPRSSFNVLDWGWLRPSGGAFTTIDDLAKMEIAVFKGKFLSTSVTNDFLSPDSIFPDGKEMVGVPWEMSFQDGYILREKGGNAYGYNSYIALVPELKLAVNYLYTNYVPLNLRALTVQVMSAVKVALSNQVSPKSIRLPKDPMAFVGNYRGPPEIPTIANIEVKLDRDTLYMLVNSGWPRFILSNINPLTFQIRIPDGTSCMRVYLLGVHNDLVRFDGVQSGVSPGFTIYGAHPSGSNYFKRIDTGNDV